MKVPPNNMPADVHARFFTALLTNTEELRNVATLPSTTVLAQSRRAGVPANRDLEFR